MIQNQVVAQLLQGRLEDYRQVGWERVEGVECAIYEKNIGERDYFVSGQLTSAAGRRLWLNPQTGLPVKITSYWIDKQGNEELAAVYDRIAVNTRLTDEELSMEAPEGFEVAVDDGPPPNDIAVNYNGGGPDAHLGVWHTFAVEDKGIVVCWAGDRSDEQRDWLDGLSFVLQSPGSPRTCRLIPLDPTSPTKGAWNWSLLVPEDGKPIQNAEVSVVLKTARTHANSSTRPLRFPPKRLATILAEAQRLTRGQERTTQNPVTLERIQELLR
jgi:hypothetical protein